MLEKPYLIDLVLYSCFALMGLAMGGYLSESNAMRGCLEYHSEQTVTVANETCAKILKRVK
jgi:hypothetical protein